MGYTTLFIVIMAVMVLVNLFLFVMIRGVVRQMDRELGASLIRQLEFADDIAAEKIRRLEDLREQESQYLGPTSSGSVQRQTAAAAPTESSFSGQASARSGRVQFANVDLEKPPTYINSDLIRQYRYIREHFTPDPQQAVDQVMRQQLPDEQLTYGRTCAAMAAVLTDDAVYQLGLLPPAEQYDVLAQMFTGQQKTVLDQMWNGFTTADSVQLREALRSEAELWQEEAVVFTPEPERIKAAPGIRLVKDPALGEGVRILRGGKLYDHSL